jgi:F-type H+-transporting ATPase subunit gamma
VANDLRDIRKRIGSIVKTQKITRAMKMVSAAKFNRATNAVLAARPYAAKIREVLAAVSSGLDPEVHPLLVARDPVRRLEVVVFTSDRGLCGSFNASIIKRAEALIARRRPELEAVTVVAVGKRGFDYFRRHFDGEVSRSWTGMATVTQDQAHEIAEYLTERYREGQTDEVLLVYSRFVSALSQEPVDQPLLPVRPAAATSPVRYEMEPAPEPLLGLLIPRAVEFSVFRALLENQAGEHGARMTAMDNATNNTEELIRTLTLDYNKARQAEITAELVEVVSGAEAL